MSNSVIENKNHIDALHGSNDGQTSNMMKKEEFSTVSFNKEEFIKIKNTLEEMKKNGMNTLDNESYVSLLHVYLLISQQQQQQPHPLPQRTQVNLQQTQLKQQLKQQLSYHQQSPRTTNTTPYDVTPDDHTGLLNTRQYEELCVQLLIWKTMTEGRHVPPQLQSLLHQLQARHNNRGSSLSPEIQTQISRWAKDISSPLTLLSSVIGSRLIPQRVRYEVIAKEEERNRQKQIIERRYQIEKELKYKENYNHDDLLDSIRIEHQELNLLPLQQQVRNKVRLCLPLDDIKKGQYRTKRQIEVAKRHRERARRKEKLRMEKDARKQQKHFLNSVTTHSRGFYSWHRWRRKICKTLANEAVKFLELVSNSQVVKLRIQERERLKALRARDETAYMELLRKHKSQRIIDLLKQTENYMAQIGAVIQKTTHSSSTTTTDNDDDTTTTTTSSANSNKKNKQTIENTTTSVTNDVMDLAKTRERYYELAHVIKEDVKIQPSTLVAGELREYQQSGLQWLVSLYNNNLNGVLADEMGLGKTIETIALFAYLMETKNNYGPFLVIAPMSTLRNNWEYEFSRWFPTAHIVVYDGPKKIRRHIRDSTLATGAFNVLLTTYEFAMRDKRYLRKINWKYVVVDEAHRLKNPKCKLVNDLNSHYGNRSIRRLALTGTPLQNDLPELWSLLNFLHPDIFTSSDNFERWFSLPLVTASGGSDKKYTSLTEVTEEEKLLIIDRLHSILRPFLLRREKFEVEKQLPNKIEKVLRCQLSAIQHNLYKKVSKGLIGYQNPVVQWTKTCTHPFLFHPYNRGDPTANYFDLNYDNLVRSCGKMELLDRILTKLKAAKHRILLFCQYVMTMDMLVYYFSMRGFKYARLDGTTPQEQRKQAIDEFNSEDSILFIFILSTKAGGLGLNLQSADTVILYESDWNPQNDVQAQSRAHRIGQSKQVLVLRLISAGTVEERILYTSLHKLRTEEVVVTAGMFNQEYSFAKSRELIEGVIRQGSSNNDQIVQDDHQVSKAIARSDEELVLFQKMDRERRRQLKKPSLVTEDELPSWVTFYPKWRSEPTGPYEEVPLMDLSLFNIKEEGEKNDRKRKRRRSAASSCRRSRSVEEEDDASHCSSDEFDEEIEEEDDDEDDYDEDEDDDDDSVLLTKTDDDQFYFEDEDELLDWRATRDPDSYLEVQRKTVLIRWNGLLKARLTAAIYR